jgi:hypothetical protein
MPSPPPLVLDGRKQTLFECGAALLALLAFPSATDTEREEIATSLCASHLRAMFEESGNPNESVKAKYAFRDEKTVREDLKKLDRSVRDRMVSAYVAIAFLQKAVGHPPKLPRDVKRLSLNQLSEFAMKQANQSVPQNFRTRVWRPSVPVIHLAAGVAVAVSNRERTGNEKISYGSLMVDKKFLGEVLTNTKQYRSIIENNRLPINPKKLVLIRLVN